IESYIHWRAGLGWHGIHCLVGPVHRDAIPLLAAFSLVAAAFAEGVSHLLAWARRTIGRFLPSPRLAPVRPRTRLVLAVAAPVAAASASAHARVSPGVVLAKQLELFTLAVPTEKEGLTTTRVEFTPPSGFGIDSFVSSPGWKRTVAQTGAGEEAVITKVTWT